MAHLKLVYSRSANYTPPPLPPESMSLKPIVKIDNQNNAEWIRFLAGLGSFLILGSVTGAVLFIIL